MGIRPEAVALVYGGQTDKTKQIIAFHHCSNGPNNKINLNCPINGDKDGITICDCRFWFRRSRICVTPVLRTFMQRRTRYSLFILLSNRNMCMAGETEVPNFYELSVFSEDEIKL